MENYYAGNYELYKPENFSTKLYHELVSNLDEENLLKQCLVYT